MAILVIMEKISTLSFRLDLSKLSTDTRIMIKEYITTAQIETSLKVIGSDFLNRMWSDVKDSYEAPHWISAFNFKLNEFFMNPYIVTESSK